VFLNNQQADSLEVIGRAFVISEELAGQFYNQARGRSLFASIDSNRISYLKFVGNAESMYFNQEDSQYVGLNHATSIDMEVFLANNRPQRIRFLQTPRGTYYPIHEVLGKENKLEGFNWAPDRRPRNYLDTTGWSFTPDSLLRLPPRSASDTATARPDTARPPLHWDDIGPGVHDHDHDHPAQDTLATLRPDSLLPVQPTQRPDSATSLYDPTRATVPDSTLQRLRATPRKLRTPEEQATLRRGLKERRFNAKVLRHKARVMRRYERENAQRIAKRKRKQERMRRRAAARPQPQPAQPAPAPPAD
jgi:hypothetical protein